MSRAGRLAALLLAVAGAVAAIALRPKVGQKPSAGQPTAGAAAPLAAAPEQRLPVLLELGSETCVPCRAMQPVLDGLRRDFADEFEVVFHDVRKDPGIGQEYGIQLIPTQIFLDASGKEIYRHEGFYPREEILKVWRSQGLALDDPAGA